MANAYGEIPYIDDLQERRYAYRGSSPLRRIQKNTSLIGGNMTREEASKQITDILEYFEDRIERETDPAFDKEIAKKDAEALRMAIQALEGEIGGK